MTASCRDSRKIPSRAVQSPIRAACSAVPAMAWSSPMRRAAFGKNLLDWAQEQSVYLAVITTGSAWSGEWASGARRVIVRLGSPEPRDLVQSELLALEANCPDAYLDAAGFGGIWESRPRAADACRLAQLIAASPGRDAEDIAREYGNWRTWIDDELHEDLGVRALMWSAAFYDGGETQDDPPDGGSVPLRSRSRAFP